MGFVASDMLISKPASGFLRRCSTRDYSNLVEDCEEDKRILKLIKNDREKVKKNASKVEHMTRSIERETDTEKQRKQALEKSGLKRPDKIIARTAAAVNWQ